MKRKWDINDEQRNKKCLEEVMTRVDEMGEEPAGIIAAQDIIDIVLENLAPEIYNKGIDDAKKILSLRLSDIETEIDILKIGS